MLLVTAATALLGGVSGLVFGFTLEALISALFCWVLVVVTRTDLEHRLIPDKIVLPGALAMVVLRTIDEPSVEWIASAIAGGLILFLIVLVYPSGLGMGDVKLTTFLGAGLGISVVVAMFVGIPLTASHAFTAGSSPTATDADCQVLLRFRDEGASIRGPDPDDYAEQATAFAATSKFAIREAGLTVGAGVITEIIA